MRKNTGKNRYEIEGDIAKVYFRNCDDYFLCDTADLHYLVDYHTWFKNNDGYARACIDNKLVKAHTYLLGRREGMEIDHRNRNKLDNRRENLRFVSHIENMRNTGVIARHNVGVYKRKGRYIASIHLKDKTIHLGCFDTEADAISARKEAEVFYWGKQANA